MDDLTQAVLQLSTDRIVILSPDGTIHGAGESLCARLNVTSQEVQGQNIFTLLPHLARLGREVLRRAVHSGLPERFQGTTHSGNPFEALLRPIRNSTGEVRHIVVRVTEKRLPKDLEDERYRLATAIEQAREAVILTDNELSIQYVNQSFEILTGYAQQEVKGKSMALLYGGRQQKALEAILESLEKEDSWMGRAECRHKNGRVVQFAKTVARIRGKRFAPMGFVSILRDLSEQEELEKQLRRAQKMEAIGTLAGGIAHDFNNILGPILIHAEVVLETLGHSHPCEESIREILEAAGRARQLVDQILNLSRGREQDKPVSFRLRFIIKECLKLLRPSLHAGVDIVFDNRSVNDLILADPTRIHQLIMNLCTNSAHAIGEREGILEIILSNLENRGERHELFPSLPRDRYVWLTVRDNGPGISSACLDKVFDPFFTTKHEDKGTGLGLTVVQNIVEGLHGTLAIRSIENLGTSVHVLIPVTDALETGDFVAAPDNCLRILSVCCGSTPEDKLVRNILLQTGYCTTFCASPYEALAKFRQDPDSYDLVLAEYLMPDMTGPDLAGEFRFTRPDLPVILCTDHTEILPVQTGCSLGVRAFLRKPFHYEEIMDVIRQVIDPEKKQHTRQPHGQNPDHR
jgi:PAS domain S-box-containing protein